MKLSKREVTEFYSIWIRMSNFINKKYQLDPTYQMPENFNDLDGKANLIIRNALWENPHWLGEIINDEIEHDFMETELQQITQWRDHHIISIFIVTEHRTNHTVFMDTKDDGKLYGVYGLLDPLKKIMPPRMLPFMGEAVLLPFKDKIIYDGIFRDNRDNIENTPPLKEVNRAYQEAKQKWGTTLTLGQ